MMTTPVPLTEPSVEDAEPSAPASMVSASSAGGARALAKPPVRKLAKDLGVDIATLTPTGPDGTVTREDVEAAASGAGAAASHSGVSAFAEGERETRVPVKGVRKMIAQAMVSSAFTAPHVTEWVTIDVTRTMELVERLKADRAFRDVKVSPLLLVAKALILAIKRNPEISAAWDEANQEIVYKRYVNLGIAAATPRGLIVPNIKDADRMSLLELAQAMGELTATAREGRTQPAETAGGTITITNVGVFGVDSGTPILNPGESAILCFGAVRDMPWVVDGEIAVRKVTQLALSFDHRPPRPPSDGSSSTRWPAKASGCAPTSRRTSSGSTRGATRSCARPRSARGWSDRPPEQWQAARAARCCSRTGPRPASSCAALVPRREVDHVK
jgi:pyruvate dehydrogenase E2 component (dihydrolipoamide acetyltransferase)